MNIEPQPYLSYLLRLWAVEGGVERTWRASLENPRSGQRSGFASLDDLFDFLRQELNQWTSDLGREEQRQDRMRGTTAPERKPCAKEDT